MKSKNSHGRPRSGDFCDFSNRIEIQVVIGLLATNDQGRARDDEEENQDARLETHLRRRQLSAVKRRK